MGVRLETRVRESPRGNHGNPGNPGCASGFRALALAARHHLDPCFWPLGIAACVFAARVKPALQIGDVTAAVKASNRVKLFFWISLAILVLYLIIVIAGSAGSSNTGY